MRTLHQESDPPHNRLHDPAERSTALSYDYVEVVRHNDVRQQKCVGRRYAILDMPLDDRPQRFFKPMTAALRSGCDVKSYTG
jgi:hypothetical protein